jgi:hypothetical protein
MTQFGLNSEHSEEEQDVSILNVQHQARVRQALMPEYVKFRKQAFFNRVFFPGLFHSLQRTTTNTESKRSEKTEAYSSDSLS